MEPILPFESWRDGGGRAGKQIFRPFVYVLQQLVFPKVVFIGHPRTRALLEERGDISSALGFMFAMTVTQCELAGLWPRSTGEADGIWRYVHGLEQQMKAQRLVLTNGVPAVLVKMPKPVASVEAFQVVVVLSPKPRYFLEEMTRQPGLSCLCEWSSEGAHLNHGDYPTMSQEDFLSNVVAVTGRS